MHRRSWQLLRLGKKANDPHVIILVLMKFLHFIQNVAKRLRGKSKFPEEAVVDLMHRLQNTHEEELSCDEVFALVDEYAEASQRGEDVASLKPLIRRHLDMCRECDEEYRALLRVLEGVQTK